MPRQDNKTTHFHTQRHHFSPAARIAQENIPDSHSLTGNPSLSSTSTRYSGSSNTPQSFGGAATHPTAETTATSQQRRRTLPNNRLTRFRGTKAENSPEIQDLLNATLFHGYHVPTNFQKYPQSRAIKSQAAIAETSNLKKYFLNSWPQGVYYTAPTNNTGDVKAITFTKASLNGLNTVEVFNLCVKTIIEAYLLITKQDETQHIREHILQWIRQHGKALFTNNTEGDLIFDCAQFNG
jgi:hypothetical protein